MALQTICILGIALWAVFVFIGISAVMVAGKSDEELGYKMPIEELIIESDNIEGSPSLPGQGLYEPGK
jgi:hypothetical protein